MISPNRLVLGLLLFASQCQAGFFTDYMIDPQDGMLDGSRYLSKVPLGFLPVPTIITEPAVGTGFAVAGVFFHESEEQQQGRITGDKFVLPKNLSLVAAGATDNGSKAAGLGHFGFWLDDQLRYRGFMLYPDLNLDFYKFGDIEPPSPVELNLIGPVVLQELKYRLGDSHWFVGARQLYRKVDTSLASSPNLTPFQDPALNQRLNTFIDDLVDRDTTTSGLGLILEFDSTNNPMNPTKGYDYSMRAVRFDATLGSDVEYMEYDFEGLNYWNLSNEFDLGLRLQYNAVNPDSGENLPTYVLPTVQLRGISATRYSGDNVVTGEVELYYKLNRRWKFNTFTGVARTGDNVGDLGSASSVHNYGAGFRYLIASRYGFWMGCDVARGPEDNAFYIQAGSSWKTH